MNSVARKAPRLLVVAMLSGSFGCGSTDKVLQRDDAEDAGMSSGGDNTGGSSGGSTGVGSTGSGTSGGTGGSTTSGGTPEAADCDMNGIWIGRQLTRSQALSAGQFSNNWYYFEIAQDGRDVTVTKHFDCGIEVRGTVTVKLTRATLEALGKENVQTGRKGKLYKEGDSCHFEMERFWSVRGADETRFAPMPRNQVISLKDLDQQNPLPKSAGAAGIEDTEKDGKDGVAWQVAGLGTRNTTQRDFTEWFSDATHVFPAASNWTKDIVVRARFDVEDRIIDPTSGLLAQLATADTTAQHLLTLRFLGRNASDPRVSAIVKASDFETCMAIQKAIAVQEKF